MIGGQFSAVLRAVLTSANSARDQETCSPFGEDVGKIFQDVFMAGLESSFYQDCFSDLDYF